MRTLKEKSRVKNEQDKVELENNYDIDYFLNMAKRMEYKGPDSGNDIQYHRNRKGYLKNR